MACPEIVHLFDAMRMDARGRLTHFERTLNSRFGARPPQNIWNNKANVKRTRSESLTPVQEAHGLAFARSISETRRAYRELAPPQQDINDETTIAQGKAYRRASSREASR